MIIIYSIKSGNLNRVKQFESSSGESESIQIKKRLIVGLKAYDSVPTLDYYLTQFDNPLSPIKHNTLLLIHFSKKKKLFKQNIK